MNPHNRQKRAHNCEETLAEFLAQMRSTEPITQPDSQVDGIINVLLSTPRNDATAVFASLIDSVGFERLLTRLRVVEKTASPEAAEMLARAISLSSDKLPRPTKKGVAAAFTQASIFVAETLRRITDEGRRYEVTSLVISEAPSLLFLCHLVQWISGSKMRLPVFTSQPKARLEQQLADRIDCHLSHQAMPIYITDRENTTTYLFALLKAARSERVRTYLTDALTARPESVSDFLWAMLPNRGYDLKTGKEGLIRIFPRQYDLLSKVIDPAFVADLIQEKLKRLRSTVITPRSESDWDIAHAQQFLAFHLKVVREKGSDLK